MAFIEWTDAISVGIKEFDTHHQKLLDLVNDLHAAMRSGDDPGKANLALADLLSYTRHHFEAEEKVMAAHEFPGLEEHRKRHRDLIEEVADLKASADAGEAVVTMKLLNFLRQWLIDHIRGMDREYTAFLQDKGVE